MSKFVSALYLVLILMLMSAVGFLGMQVSQLNEKLANSQHRSQKVKVNTDQFGKEIEAIKKDIARHRDVLKEFSAEVTQLSLDIKTVASKEYMSPLSLSVGYPLFSVETNAVDSKIQSIGYVKRLDHWYNLNEPFMDYIVKKSLPLEFDRTTQNVVVQETIEGSFFHQMGFRKGDGIVAINGKRLMKGPDIRTELMIRKPTQIQILRDGKRYTLDVSYEEGSSRDVALNLSKSQYSEQIEKLQLLMETEPVVTDGQMVGVKIVDLQPESILNSMKLKKEDVITRVNGKPVGSQDLVSTFKTVSDVLQIDVLRDNQKDSVFVSIHN